MRRNVFAALLGVARLAFLAGGILLGFGLSLTSAHAGPLYATGFEPPQFAAGQTVNGQGGFTVSGNPAALVVTTSLPHSGPQALEALGSQLTGSPGFVQATAGVPFIYNASNSVVTLGAFVRLDGPSTNTGNGTADDLVSINLEAILSDGSYFSTYLSSDGQAYAFTTNYDFSAPAALGEYHDLQLALNFVNRTSTFAIDGQVLGTLPFDPSVTSDVLSSAQFTMYAIVPPFNPSVNAADYTARVDDFSVTAVGPAVPEPSSLLIALTGMCGVSAWLVGPRWRRGRVDRCLSKG